MFRHTHKSFTRTVKFHLTAIAMIACLAAMSARATAAVTSGESSAFGLSVDVDLVDQNNLLNLILGANLGPIPSVSGRRS